LRRFAICDSYNNALRGLMTCAHCKEMLLKVELTLARLFGFLTGATTAGAGMYYYVIDEYRVSNQLLTEDIYVCPLLE
jgi:hypothetical protein